MFTFECFFAQSLKKSFLLLHRHGNITLSVGIRTVGNSITFVSVLILFSLQNFEAEDSLNTPSDKKERFGAWNSDKVSVKLSFSFAEIETKINLDCYLKRCVSTNQNWYSLSFVRLTE